MNGHNFECLFVFLVCLIEFHCIEYFNAINFFMKLNNFYGIHFLKHLGNFYTFFSRIKHIYQLFIRNFSSNLNSALLGR
jgi:hypothetical protein